jgi:hypothetical protein
VIRSVGVPCSTCPSAKYGRVEDASANTRKLTAIGVRSRCTGFIRTQTLHVNVLEGNIAGLEDDRMPEGRVGDRDTVDGDMFSSGDG